MVMLVLIVFVLLLTVGTSIYLMVMVARRRPFRGDVEFAALGVTTALIAAAYLFEGLVTDPSLKILMSNIKAIGSSTLSTFFLIFAFKYTGALRERAALQRWLWVIPVSYLLLAWTNSSHRWVYVGFEIGVFGEFKPLIFENSWLFAVMLIYHLLAGAIALLVMLRYIVSTRPIYRGQIPLIVLATLAPMASFLLYILGNGLDWTPLGLGIGNALLGQALIRHKLFTVTPVAYDAIIANLRDGVMTADLQGRILDLNPAATVITGFDSRIIGLPLHEAFGQSIHLAQHVDGVTPVNQQIEFSPHADHWIQMDLQSSQIRSQNGAAEGWLLVLRDVTRELAMETDLKAHTKALEEQNKRQSALADLGLTINQTHDLDIVLQSTIDLVTELFPAPSGASIAIWDSDSERFVSQASSIDQRVYEPLSNQARQAGGASHWVVSNKDLLVVSDTRQDPFGHQKLLSAAGIGSYVSMPLIAEGNVLGTLFANDSMPRDFSEPDLNFLRALAHRAASAVHRAKLFHEIDRQAKMDELTQLWNRRHLFNLGRREFERAQRYRRPLAALMVDIDNFKRINDSYGHRTGDNVLVALAAQMKKTLRSFDIVGRYGGEEFVAVLPEVSEQEALIIAERLAQQIRDMALAIENHQIMLTVSIGIAMPTHDTASFESLVDQADTAMYESKHAGRDQVNLYQPEQARA